MYETHFGLKEKPFSLTPNPRFLYLSRTHQEALAHLRYGLENRVGFIAVTGEVGTGKTTILRQLFGQLDESRFRLAMIFNPCLTSMELLRNVNREFGLPARKRSNLALVEELNQFLLTENSEGRTPVLVVDEAQNLEADVLEQIRLLSNLETDSDKLIQIVLVGQPELDELLARSDLRQLAQRIAVRCRLGSLDRHETREYVRHRLQIAGVFGDLFDEKALSEAFRWTGGVPRLINVLCDRALLCAYTDNRHRVSFAEVCQAKRELMHVAGEGGWLGAWGARVRQSLTGDRYYWCLGTVIVLEIIALILMSRMFV
jgi:general secretion pathway protein A